VHLGAPSQGYCTSPLGVHSSKLWDYAVASPGRAPHSWSGWLGEEENLCWLSWFSGMSCRHGMSLVTQPLKIKALCSLEMSGNTAATHSRIPEYLDQEPWFLGHPPCSLVRANWAKPQVPNGYSSRTEWESGNVGWWRGLNMLSNWTYNMTDNKNSPSIREWLMMPPKQYATRNIMGHDWSIITYIMRNWTSTIPVTTHLKLGS
jgi:hypothetical protein